MQDPTEQIRRARMAELAQEAGPRAELEAQYGEVWDTAQLRERFEVIGFMAPYVVARDQRTDKKGSLEFQASPRFYFNWVED